MADPVAQLIALYREAEAEILEALDEIASAQSFARKAFIYSQLVNMLRQLQGETQEWADSRISQFVVQAGAKAGRAIGTGNFQLGSTINTRAVEALSRDLTSYLSSVGQSATSEALRLFRATSLSRAFPDLDRLARRQVAVGLSVAESDRQISDRIRELLQERFKNGLVAIPASDGRTYHYGVPYYARLVANNTRRQAMSVGTILLAQEQGEDLIRVSENPSKDGDFCDSFAGKCFSLSGTHPTFPPYDWIPPIPAHCWCTHSISVFQPELYPSGVEDELIMDPQWNWNNFGRNINELNKAWKGQSGRTRTSRTR